MSVRPDEEERPTPAEHAAAADAADLANRPESD